MYRHCNLMLMVATMLLGVFIPSWAQTLDATSKRDMAVRFSEVLDRFAKRNAVNLLADYSIDEEAGSLTNVSILRHEPTIENILSVYRRKAARVGSTVVLLRTVDNYYSRYLDARLSSIFGDLVWKGSQLEVRASRDENGVTRITLRASGVSLKQLCERFQKETGWQIELDPSLHSVRIFARWQAAPLGEVVEAIAVLLRADMQVKVLLSEEQKAAQRLEVEQRLKDSPSAQRGKRSDELLPDLLALLTPEETERFRRGEKVDIPLSRLPADVYDRALQYVVFCIDSILSVDPDNELSRIRDSLRHIDVILHLPSVMENGMFAPTIGVSVKNLDGVWDHF